LDLWFANLSAGSVSCHCSFVRQQKLTGDSWESGTHTLKIRTQDAAIATELLGYLNFSGGRPDPKFERNINEFLLGVSWNQVADALRQVLAELHQSSPTFGDCSQAEQVIALTFDRVLPAYREHHRDLLFHLKDEDFQQPFFLAKVFEAVLEQGAPWDEPDRIVAGALNRLNDFIGYRPIAVLENGQRMEPYPHERFRPLPLFLRGAGVVNGPYRAMLERALELLQQMPPDVLSEAYFNIELMDELAVDLRAHDHIHPANKRTNYLFGEWDPHQIDIKGRYRRFVVRKVILDALLDWAAKQKRVDADEVLFDISAVLCGTILMASSISGDGPECHDSNVTLSSLLPRVARQRDEFYARLVQTATGARAKRLARQAKLTRQPFGHVRQALNMFLAQYGAQQVQRRQLSYLFARMGYAEASLRQAAVIPCASARFECEVLCRSHTARRIVEQGKLAETVRLLEEAEDYLHRGIDCGALVDPWNVLGFQGLFPLFSSREDSVPDQRIEMLYHIMESLLDAYSRALEEAAARGDKQVTATISARYERLAQFWDRFGTVTVEDLPRVAAHEQLDSASHVARALAEWREAGESAGDISFWRTHVDQFQSSKAYAQVVSALLERRDRVAALGLLMQWLSQHDSVGLEAGHLSFEDLMLWWMGLVAEEGTSSKEDPWPIVRRMFDYLEANAGELWQSPVYRDGVIVEESAEAGAWLEDRPAANPGQPHDTGDDLEDSEDEDELFSAAYDDVVYRDSTDDGQEGPVMDDRTRPEGDTEFERLEKRLDPRLKFLRMLAQLWQLAANLAVERELVKDADGSKDAKENRAGKSESLRRWLEHSMRLQNDLARLIDELWKGDIGESTGEHDSNVEFDSQLQAKLYLVQSGLTTWLSCRSAQWCLACALAPEDQSVRSTAEDVRVIDMYRGIMQRNEAEVRRVLPGLLKSLQRKPLLYVPLEHGGDPRQILAARSQQMVVRFLLAHLPQLGLLRETWHLLRTARHMERVSRPRGMAVTEFDRLFRIALRNTLECVVRASRDWKGGRFTDEELIEVVGEIVELYLDDWLEHSSTMRLSSVEALKIDSVWSDTAKFVKTYGSDILNARVLTLGNVRAILHSGVPRFLEYLEQHEDPLHPVRLLDDLRSGKVDREDAAEQLHLIYQVVVEKFDRFLEYNTTTTQSDYGEQFYSLLDFLRLETSYDRDAWNLLPVAVAHEVLARQGKPEAAIIWEDVFTMRTEEMAETHLEDLESLQKKYGMRLPSVTNHLQERFVKPLAVNHMLAQIRPACEDADAGRQDSPSFQVMQAEVEEYLKTTSGSGLDVPAWLKTLEEELQHVHESGEAPLPDVEPQLRLPAPTLSLKDLRQQLKGWKQPPGERKGKA
jgi:hypothetical protein